MAKVLVFQPCWDCRKASAFSTIAMDYMVTDEVWEEAGGNPAPSTLATLENETPNTFICLECLEVRLGRELEPEDFTGFPINNEILWVFRKFTS